MCMSLFAFYLSVYLSIDLLMNPSVCLSINVSISLSLRWFEQLSLSRQCACLYSLSFRLSIYLSIDLQWMYYLSELSVDLLDSVSCCVSVDQSVNPSINLSIYQSVNHSVCLSIDLPACQLVRVLSVDLSSIHSLWISVFVCQRSICLSVSLLKHQSVCLCQVYVSVCWSICLLVCLSYTADVFIHSTVVGC